MNIVGLHVCLFIYAVGSAIGAIFVLCVQKETSGASLDHVDNDNFGSLDTNVIDTDRNENTQTDINQLFISDEKV